MKIWKVFFPFNPQNIKTIIDRKYEIFLESNKKESGSSSYLIGSSFSSEKEKK
jgi:hypothetical protein